MISTTKIVILDTEASAGMHTVIFSVHDDVWLAELSCDRMPVEFILSARGFRYTEAQIKVEEKR